MVMFIFAIMLSTNTFADNSSHPKQCPISNDNIPDANHLGDCPKFNNEIFIGEGLTEITDLVNSWSESGIGWRHSFAGFGSITTSINTDYRFGMKGAQLNVDAYPSLGRFGYMYLNYGYSPYPSIFPRDRYGVEPFFSLPHASEASLGMRYLHFVGANLPIYTGSVAKYVGNYWFSLRGYYVPDSNSGGSTSGSLSLTVRRYFLCGDDYIALSLGGGAGKNPRNVNVIDSDPTALSSFYISSYGKHPFNQRWYANWSLGYYKEKYPYHIRNQIALGAGVSYRFD